MSQALGGLVRARERSQVATRNGEAFEALLGMRADAEKFSRRRDSDVLVPGRVAEELAATPVQRVQACLLLRQLLGSANSGSCIVVLVTELNDGKPVALHLSDTY